MTANTMWDVLETLHRTLITFEATEQHAKTQALLGAVTAAIDAANSVQPVTTAPSPSQAGPVNDLISSIHLANTSRLSASLASAQQAIVDVQARINNMKQESQQQQQAYRDMLLTHRRK